MVCNNIVTNKFITNKIITFNVKQHSLATTRHLFPPFTAGYRHVYWRVSTLTPPD